MCQQPRALHCQLSHLTRTTPRPARDDGEGGLQSILKAVQTILKDTAQMDGKAIKRMFKDMDADKSGSLTRDELALGLSKLGVKCRKKDFTELMKVLDANGDGEVQYKELKKAAAAAPPTAEEEAAAREAAIEAGKPPPPTAAESAAIADVWKKISKHAKTTAKKSGEFTVRGFFVAIDEDGSGTVTIDELMAGLTSIGIKFTKHSCTQMMAELDPDGDGFITYAECNSAMRTHKIKARKEKKKAGGNFMPF